MQINPLKKPQYIGVVGHKKSGKTTLIEHLAKELTARGLIIGTIKITTHDLRFDSPGKDTHRHRAAGSQVTMIKSKSEMAVFTNSDYLDDDSVKALFGKCDFVFVEGDSGSQNPKIYVADDRETRDDISGDIIAVWGTKTETIKAPHFETGQVTELCDFLNRVFREL